MMPPPTSNKKLTAEQKALLKRWVAGGALPGALGLREARQGRGASRRQRRRFPDARRLAALGVQPSPQADPRTLIRRLSFDLLGLPPAPPESKRLWRRAAGTRGQHMRSWSSGTEFAALRRAHGDGVARSGPLCGHTSATTRQSDATSGPYRDYVMLFNDNKPFDQFTVEQLAGDLLVGSTTGAEGRFGLLTLLLLTTEEGGAQPTDYEVRMLTDRVRAVGTV